MKKNLFSLLAVFTLLAVGFTSCEDKPEIPPVVEDVIATYSTEKLKLEVGGTPAAADASVELVQLADKSVTIKLQNIIPGVKTFEIPGAKFEAIAKSDYTSKLTGKATDNVSGYEVDFIGNVDAGILTAKITYTEIAGVPTDTKKNGLQPKTYRGEMAIYVSDIPEAIKMEQRIYTSAPKDKDTSKIKLQINDFAFGNIELGNIILDTISVQKRGMKDGKPIFAFQAKERKLKLSLVGDVVIDIKGTIINEVMSLDLAVNATTVGLTVKVEFGGNIVTESTDTKTTISVTGDAVVDPVASSGTKYTFKIWESTPAAQLLLTPKVELAEKATIDSVVLCNNDGKKVEMLKLNTPIDFSKVLEGYYVAYYVKAEDVRTRSTKRLYVERLPDTFVYDMKTWILDRGNQMPTPKGLTNSNAAAIFFPMFGIDVPTPVLKAADNAAEITTSRTVSTTFPNGLIPGVTAGTMFVGEFSVDVENTLKSTHFGTRYMKKPATFKVEYRYAPGTTFYKTISKTDEKGNKYNDTEVVPGELDECSINAYLYEVANYDEHLDGTNVNTSTKVILKASIVSGATSGSGYVSKEITFAETGNGSYDPTKKYKLAIVCSSSKRGDEFMGANGSKLWIKYLEVVAK